jgi:hypothetical protein
LPERYRKVEACRVQDFAVHVHEPLYTLAVAASIVKGLYDSGLDFLAVVLFGSHQLRHGGTGSPPPPSLSLGLSTSVKQGHARIHNHL